MEVLNERHAVIIIHPHRPTPYPEKIIATTPLAMYEYPAETTRAVVNMLARNVLVRYPNLKVVVPHCGSFLPLAFPRMKSILPAMVAQGYMQPIDWEGNLSRLYFDLAGNPTAEVLHSLLTITSPDHILYGSDYPYLPDAVLKGNLQRLRQTLAADKELSEYEEMFLWENAERLFERNATDGRCPPGHNPTSVTDLDTLSSGLRSINIRSLYLRQRQSARISTVRGSDSTYPVVWVLWKHSDGAKNLQEVPSEIFSLPSARFW